MKNENSSSNEEEQGIAKKLIFSTPRKEGGREEGFMLDSGCKGGVVGGELILVMPMVREEGLSAGELLEGIHGLLEGDFNN